MATRSTDKPPSDPGHFAAGCSFNRFLSNSQHRIPYPVSGWLYFDNDFIGVKP